ncbi:MAG: gliding motility-associated C-terminal domain-containing protein, partial [Bacteroidota bacterium]
RNVSGDANIYDPINFPPQNGTITATGAIPDAFFDIDPEVPQSLFCQGDQICYDVKISGFDDIISVTGNIGWDTSVIKFTEVKNFEHFQEDQFFVPMNDETGESSNRAKFSYIDFNLATLTLPDSTRIFTLCYEVVGNSGANTKIEIINTTEEPTEVSQDDNGNQFNFDVFQLGTPEIAVADCETLSFSISDCADTQFEETTCIDFTTTNFRDITNAKFTVTYDPTLLEFVRTENYSLNGLTDDNFSVNNGVLTFDWSSATPENVADGDFLFSACFKAIGPIDSLAQLTFLNLAGNGFEISNAAGESIEPKFFDCEFQILPPTVTISAPTTTFPPNEEFCLPLTVTNFINVTHLEMPIEWDPAVLAFVSVNPIGLDGLTADNFEDKDVNDGKLQLVTWDSPTNDGINLDDGESIFEVCFKVVGAIGDETPISFPTADDNPPFAINSSGKFPEVAPINGQITVAAGGLILESTPQEILEDQSVCVDVTTRNFSAITSLDYSHVFDSNVLTFDSVIVDEASVFINEDFNAIGLDEIKVGWATDDPLAGSTLADGSVLYTLCFTAKEALGRCGNFAVADGQEVTTVESMGEDIGIFNNLGDICVDNFGLIVADSTPTQCGGAEGSLTLNVPGDPNERFFYSVNKDGATFISNEDVENGQILLADLEEGVYAVTLTALDDFSKTVTRTYDLSLDESDFPMIDLGEDLDAGCIEQGTPIDLTLDGSSFTLPQNAGGVITRSWEVLGTEGTIVGDTTQDLVNVTSTGSYIFTVLINNTNCSASDTISILRTQPPNVQVMQSATLGCTNNTIELEVEIFNPEENPNATFIWTTQDGNIVGADTVLNPVVDQEGIYKFIVTDTVNNCVVADSTFIFEDKAEPNASAGPDLEMGCLDNFIRLTGMGDAGTQTEWTTIDGSSITYPNANDQQIADVTRVGTYIFTATNQINGCATSDTMVINADESLPVARTANLVTIGCDTNVVVLDGSNSSAGDVFAYRWEGPGQALLTTENVTTADAAGEYLLIVTNNSNADCIADSIKVTVREDKEKPEVRIPNSLTFGCMTDCTPLSAVVPEGDNYTYEWTTEDGVICGAIDSATTSVASIGVYRILVTNTDNNCSASAPSIVGGDGTQIFAETGPDRTIDCQDDVVTLDGRGSDTGSSTLTFSWENEAGQEISTEKTVEVNEPGEYTLKLLDTETGCDAIGTVSVTVDQAVPFAEAGEAPEVSGCEFPTGRRLNANESESGDNIIYAWTSTSGNLVGDTSITAPEISGPGRFVLTVTNRTNGCSSTDEVLVQSDVLIPIANAGNDRVLTCDEPMLSLAGLNETFPPETKILWTTDLGNITSDNDELSISVDAPGTYVLSITSPDGCTATDEVEVTSTLDLPDADAGQELAVTCNRPLVINALGSEGANFMVEWSTAGGNIISGGDTYTPVVDRGGSYTLTVTNTDNNCQSSSVVLVRDENDLPVANAGADQEICINEATLMAELPVGFSGTWTTLEQSMVIDPNDANTSVADLADGLNTYLWTLSNDQCGAFSTDTMRVNVPTLPIVNDDQFEIEPGTAVSILDLVQNDQLNTVNFAVNILAQPSAATLTPLAEGVYEFSTPARYFGTQQFQYEVCNMSCSNLCSVATVRVVVKPGEDVDTTNTIPNAITPNGDGMNDMLQVDELIFDAFGFPQSEMVIFNRWGDIVFRASPYNNDWQGQGNDGRDLPEGTYYYVLRLDISEGEVMKGDVTILR